MLNSMKKSTSFMEEHKEEILSWFAPGSDLYSIELDSKKLSSLFDQYSGVDYVLVRNYEHKMLGVAARVNFWEGNFKHVTIRYKRKSGNKTEYEKRLSSIINNDSIYPHVTLQVDSINDKIVSGLIYKTDDLYKNMLQDIDEIAKKYMRVCKEGNQYLRLPFEFVQKNAKSKLIGEIK